MSACLAKFPDQLEREVIKTAAQTWLQTRDMFVRGIMSNYLRQCLTSLGVTRIVAGNMVVTMKNGSVRISPQKTVFGSKCNCGQDIYSDKVKILYITEGFRSHKVTYGCQCGEIFNKNEEIGEC